MEAVPQTTPYMVLKLGDDSAPSKSLQYQELTVWVHDTPGSYQRIGEILEEVRLALVNNRATSNGMIIADWQGHSGDLADDAMGTIVRTSSYRLVGTRQEV